MNPSARKAVGSLFILAYLIVYIVLAVMLGERLHALPFWVPALYYCAAGFAWVFPLRPLFRWMNAKDQMH